ncbi:MAG: ImmA/IrrE family metallo-endopeptidase [Clostridiales bacterium]|nr:ImmA/IrrE family metallo-endopeptidase [Clostridiales bacterium]
MTKLEELENEAYNNNIDIVRCNFNSNRIKGLYCDGTVALNKSLSNTEKTCVLAEELGHYYTAVGNILCQKDENCRKQEMKGRIVSYNMMVGLNGIIKSYKHGCRSLYEASEFLEVTEEFLSEALQYYRSKYGAYTIVDKYVIYFEPSLGVLELK